MSRHGTGHDLFGFELLGRQRSAVVRWIGISPVKPGDASTLFRGSSQTRDGAIEIELHQLAETE